MTVLSKIKTYGVDLDGVSFDFLNAFRVYLNNALGIDLKESEVTHYYWHESTDKITKEQFYEEFHRFGKRDHGYRNLALLPGVLEALNKITAAGHKIYYITNRPPYAHQDTIDCLEEHQFPQRENLHLAKGSKVPLVKELGVDVFIDDSPETLIDLVTQTRANIYCRDYLFNKHLDDTFLTRVNGWYEFIKNEGL